MTGSRVICQLQCDDQRGIIAAITGLVAHQGGNIVHLDQHTDGESGRFFMRLAWDAPAEGLDEAAFHEAMRSLPQYGHLDYQLFRGADRPRIAVWCSTTPHCLYDLLLRQQMGEFGGHIVVVMSNHQTLRDVTEHFGVPFVWVPTENCDKAAVEDRQRDVLAEYAIDLIVLARYMQILSPQLVAQWQGRVINIHHSFLPAFVGARPYHQARERGVKIIGATAHYVTADLDQGPIIEQDVARVSHSDSIVDLVRQGRDLERQVLARALRLHLEHRVLIDGQRTVVFDS